jgi:hypothetical protein
MAGFTTLRAKAMALEVLRYKTSSISFWLPATLAILVQ